MELIIDFPGGARVDAHFNGFTVATDQTVTGGGENSAPYAFCHFPGFHRYLRGYLCAWFLQTAFTAGRWNSNCSDSPYRQDNRNGRKDRP